MVDLETRIDHAPGLLVYTFNTKEGARSLHISVKNHDTQTDNSKFIYKALTLPGNRSFSNVIDREATKVLYSLLPPDYLAILEKGF